MTVPLTRHQHLEVVRHQRRQWLLVCCTLERVEGPTGKLVAGYVCRVLWEWPKEGKR